MSKLSPFSCLHPVKIHHYYTDDIIQVPCGKCAACRARKDSIATLKCNLEGITHRYCVFITLTYRNECLPTAAVCGINHSYLGEDTIQIYSHRTGALLSECNMSRQEQELLRSHVDLPAADGSQSYSIPILDKKDLQDFLKRLRKNLSKYTDEKIRYYAVGEYGPVHFRPHFHLLVWFNRQETCTQFAKCLYKSWQNGYISHSFTDNGATSYVASYVNSLGCLPCVYAQKGLKPFSIHSQHLGDAILKDGREKVYQMPYADFATRCIPLGSSNTEFALWRSLKHYYYPKCRDYVRFSHDERHQAYRTYARISELFEETRPYSLAKKVVNLFLAGRKDVIHSLKEFDFIAHYTDIPILEPCSEDMLEMYIRPFLMKYEDYVARVYTILRISEHFLNFCCDGDWSWNSTDKMVYLIEDYWSWEDLQNLKEQYISMEEFVQSENCTVDELVYFYHNAYYDEDDKELSRPYLSFKSKYERLAKERIKHKELNDRVKLLFDKPQDYDMYNNLNK